MTLRHRRDARLKMPTATERLLGRTYRPPGYDPGDRPGYSPARSTRKRAVAADDIDIKVEEAPKPPPPAASSSSGLAAVGAGGKGDCAVTRTSRPTPSARDPCARTHTGFGCCTPATRDGMFSLFKRKIDFGILPGGIGAPTKAHPPSAAAPQPRKCRAVPLC